MDSSSKLNLTDLSIQMGHNRYLNIKKRLRPLAGEEACAVCGRTIEQTPVQNHGTYLCAGCQPVSHGNLI
ncbi:MAG: hypothetical protein A2Z77_00165 [Chloroflexi bacterium RBG_13_51_36]|nr:MAG: hypothetical protein A2Z77_00165 [Chloroflexi bacterium RBG_13_51_36]